jgi:hypothetical protein
MRAAGLWTKTTSPSPHLVADPTSGTTNNFDVLADDDVVGRIFKANAVLM